MVDHLIVDSLNAMHHHSGMAIAFASSFLTLPSISPSFSHSRSFVPNTRRYRITRVNVNADADTDTSSSIMCEPCNGKGWLLCDFCGGQKTNVKAQNKRIYRRCPTCRAIGYVLCSKCKVFKCVTFPDFND